MLEEPRQSNEPLLNVDGLVTGYGKKQVVYGVSVGVAAGEIVTLIGDNGAGKSSIVRAIAIALIGPRDAQALRLPLISWLKQDSEQASGCNESGTRERRVRRKA